MNWRSLARNLVLCSAQRKGGHVSTMYLRCGSSRPRGYQVRACQRPRRRDQCSRRGGAKLCCWNSHLVRPAQEADKPALSAAIWRERMNPLGINTQRFLVAEDSAAPGRMKGFGQLAPLGPSGALELRSLVVLPDSRGEGVGRFLLRSLIERGSGSDIFLTTLGSTTDFYEREGFLEVTAEGIPRELLFEWLAGQVVARLVANQRCLVMKRPADSGK